MSNQPTGHESNDSQHSFRLDEDTWMKMRSKTFLSICGAIVMAVAAVVGYGVSLKGDVSNHTKQLSEAVQRQESIERKVDADHELLWEQRSSMKSLNATIQAMNEKLDYLTDGRRGPKPATGTP